MLPGRLSCATRSRVTRAQAGSAAHAGRRLSTASASPRASARTTSSTRARSSPGPVSARASRNEMPRKTNAPKAMAVTSVTRRKAARS